VLAVESTTRFFIVDGLRRASNAYDLISAIPWCAPAVSSSRPGGIGADAIGQ